MLSKRLRQLDDSSISDDPVYVGMQARQQHTAHKWCEFFNEIDEHNRFREQVLTLEKKVGIRN